MEQATPRNDLELAEVYNLGLADLRGERNAFLARKLSGHERRLGKTDAICWAILPASVLTHRAAVLDAPSFDKLNDYERHGLRYTAIAIEHGRESISISLAAGHSESHLLYFEQALLLIDAIKLDRLWRAEDGSIVVTGRKRLGGDALHLAVDILDVCKETRIEPIPMSLCEPPTV